MSATEASISLGTGGANSIPEIVLDGKDNISIRVGNSLKVDETDKHVISGSGAFISGSGEFLIGDSEGGSLQYQNTYNAATGLIEKYFVVSSSLFEFRVDDDNYLSQSDKGLEIKSSNLDLSASNFQVSSNMASMSLGTRREIILDGAHTSSTGEKSGDVSLTVGYPNIVVDTDDKNIITGFRLIDIGPR